MMRINEVEARLRVLSVAVRELACVLAPEQATAFRDGFLARGDDLGGDIKDAAAHAE